LALVCSTIVLVSGILIIFYLFYKHQAKEAANLLKKINKKTIETEMAINGLKKCHNPIKELINRQEIRKIIDEVRKER
jgi:uncharacterized protein YneF (UPF0154 family)